MAAAGAAHAVLIVSGAQQADLDPDNDYLTEQSDAEARMFEQATSLPIDVMTAVDPRRTRPAPSRRSPSPASR